MERAGKQPTWVVPEISQIFRDAEREGCGSSALRGSSKARDRLTIGRWWWQGRRIGLCGKADQISKAGMHLGGDTRLYAAHAHADGPAWVGARGEKYAE